MKVIASRALGNHASVTTEDPFIPATNLSLMYSPPLLSLHLRAHWLPGGLYWITVGNGHRSRALMVTRDRQRIWSLITSTPSPEVNVTSPWRADYSTAHCRRLCRRIASAKPTQVDSYRASGLRHRVRREMRRIGNTVLPTNQLMQPWPAACCQIGFTPDAPSVRPRPSPRETSFLISINKI